MFFEITLQILRRLTVVLILFITIETLSAYELRSMSKQQLGSGSQLYRVERNDEIEAAAEYVIYVDRVASRLFEINRQKRKNITALVMVPDFPGLSIRQLRRGGRIIIEIPGNVEKISTNSEELRRLIDGIYSGGVIGEFSREELYTPDFIVGLIGGSITLQQRRERILRINYYNLLRGMLEFDANANWLDFLQKYRISGKFDLLDKLYFELTYAANEIFRSTERDLPKGERKSYIKRIMDVAFFGGQAAGDKEFTKIIDEITEKKNSSASNRNEIKSTYHWFNRELFYKVFNFRHPASTNYIRRRLTELSSITVIGENGEEVINILEYPVFLEELPLDTKPDPNMAELTESFRQIYVASPQAVKRSTGDLLSAVGAINSRNMSAAEKKKQLQRIFAEVEDSLKIQDEINSFLESEEKKILTLPERYKEKFEALNNESELLSSSMQRYFSRIEDRYMQ